MNHSEPEHRRQRLGSRHLGGVRLLPDQTTDCAEGQQRELNKATDRDDEENGQQGKGAFEHGWVLLAA